MFIIDNQAELRSRFYLIASSHAIIFSRVVRAAGQYRGNPLCTPCAPIFSRNISCNGHIHFSITFSYFPRSLSSSFNVLFSSRRRASETFPSLSRLFTFTLWTRLTFAILFLSSRNILQNIQAPLPHRSTFLFMRREHSQSQYIKFSVCMQITSWRIFLRLSTPPACYFPVNPPSFLSLRQYLLPAEFQLTLSRHWPKEKGVSRKLKLFRG